MPFKNKDASKLFFDNNFSFSINNSWPSRTFSSTVTLSGDHIQEMLDVINNSPQVDTYTISLKTKEDATITLNNVRFQSDISNGEGDYMIYSITASDVRVKEPERIKDIKEQMSEIP